ncbi:23S rRNA (guanosine(2251)-2'-O)-methyltransferase RlmB [Falsiporphyromonas endometrii]|uniref:23S rRNA (Guanosine(2251)-2'-O)-methyltransferase RlmB n=1 Tax=Falsiporphyromonas endometrii TaxID=1387297 RepID=A0ABV9K590_9PORP
MAKDKLIYGIHSIEEALLAGKELDKIFLRRAMRGDDISRIKALARDRMIPVLSVPEEKLSRMTSKNHQGIVAYLSQIEYMPLEEVVNLTFEEGQLPFIVVLDGVTDVRNFGAIARTAECAGVDAIVIPGRGSVSVSGDAIKASAGALHRIPVCRVNSINEALDILNNSGVRIVTASEKTDSNYTETDMTLPLAIVMGAEDVGPSEESIRRADEIVTIPQCGEIGSLNVSVAAGILIYEAVRQNGMKS